MCVCGSRVVCNSTGYRSWSEGAVYRVGMEDATESRLEEDEQRRARKAAAHAGVGATASMPFKSDTCQRTFRRRQDISRHRCATCPKGQVVTRLPS